MLASYCRARRVVSDYENCGDLETTLEQHLDLNFVGFLGELCRKAEADELVT